MEKKNSLIKIVIHLLLVVGLWIIAVPACIEIKLREEMRKDTDRKLRESGHSGNS